MNHLSDLTLNEYLDSALEPARRAEVEAHVAACPDCAARLAELRALFAALESLPEASLERDLTSAVTASIRRARLAAQPALSPKLRLVIAVQALAALILLAIALPFAAQILEWAELWERVAPAIDVAVFSSTWAAAVNSAQSLLSQGQAAFDSLPWPTLSALGLGAFFAAASALWLVGNGLLIAQLGRNHTQQRI